MNAPALLRRGLNGLAGALVLATLTGGCGGARSASSTVSGVSSKTRSPSAAVPARIAHRPQRASVRGAPIGRAQIVHAGGSTLSVTVRAVLDPLGGTGSPLPPGTRAAGVTLTVRNLAGSTYDSTASGDLVLLTQGGAAAPLFVRDGVCATPLTDFESLVGAGETREGCVAFAVPRSGRILGVRFDPHSRPPGGAVWVRRGSSR
jgi:hypothetical protein